DAVVQEWDQDAVDDEARRVAAADRLPTEALGERERRLDDVVGGPLGADNLDEGHQRGRVEEVQAQRAFRPLEPAGDGADRKCGRVRGEDRVSGTDALELRE